MKKLLLALFASAACGTAAAQSWPSKPLRVIVAFPPGGSVDLLARYMGQKMVENLGQPVLVENRPGGNTNIAAEFVARSPADGYTILHTLDSTLTINQALYEKIPFDPVKDFAPVSRIVIGNTLIASSASLPVRSVRELFEYAKANPGKLNYGATAASTQILAEQFKALTGANIVYVPYKGTAQLVPALLNGEIHFIIDGVTLYVPYIKEGKMRALATFAPVKDLLLPDAPTIREAGFPQLERRTWWGWFAAAGTPSPIVSRLNASIVWAMGQPDLREKVMGLGLFPNTSTPEELAADVKADIARWTPIIKAAGLKAD
jgi:tripartite-type tricarboxylate transporter receptor subunit TctC